MNTLPTVVFATDDAYCRPLQVALASLCASNPALRADIRVVVLHEDLSPAARWQIEALADHLELAVELRAATLPEVAYNTAFGGARANYLRLSIPDSVGQVDRVLYLDADIVVRGDLSDLFSVDLRGLPIGAVRDPINPTLATGRALPNWPELGLDGDREYFNSGVLVLDLAACAERRIFDRAFEAIVNHSSHLRMWDQDALNLAADDRWYRLDRRWNTVPFEALSRTPWIRYTAQHVMPAAQLIADERDAAIMHYVTPSKPWRGLLPRGSANDIYQTYLGSLERSGFAINQEETS